MHDPQIVLPAMAVTLIVIVALVTWLVRVMRKEVFTK